MAYGDGTITPVKGKPKTWRVYVDFGTDPITGKRLRPSRVVHGSKADARKVRDELIRQHEGGLRVEAAGITFGEWSRQWEKRRNESDGLEVTTKERTKEILDLLRKYLENVKLSDITPQTVDSLYCMIKADKEAAGASYGGTSMNKLHIQFKHVMRDAVNYDLIMKNPLDRVKAPAKDKPQRNSLTSKEAERLLSCVDEAERWGYSEYNAKESRQFERGNGFGRAYLRGLPAITYPMAIRIAIATGMRRGEILALSWGCVDTDSGTIKVLRSLTAHGELKAPKSDAGIRTIAIDGDTVAHIKAWRDFQRIQLLKIGVKLNDETPVCCSETGLHICTTNLERWWRSFRTDNGFDGLKIHELRHTQATQLLANGVDVKTVQNRLGHASASITLNFYAHALPENDRAAADLVGTLFHKKNEETPIIKVKTA